VRILVTGGCGFLGSHIVEHFLKNTDAELVVLDKMTYASSGFDRLRDIQAFDDHRVRVLGCDLAQPIPEGVAREVGDVDYVIHAAAETHVDNSIVDPLPFLQANVIGTHHLLWWLRSVKSLRRAFLVSTDEVYGPAAFGEDVAGFDEQAAFRPANPYAAAKAGGECVAMSYANTYKLPITIVNTMNLVGERQHVEKMVPKCIRAALLGETMTIHADETRTRAGTRFYLHCRTFAHALAFLIERDYRLRALALGDGEPPDVAASRGMPLKIHVCGEREISNLDLAQMIAGFVDKPLHYDLVSWHASRPGHDLRYAMSDELIEKLGWQRPMMLEQSLEKTVRWYLDNPKWLDL
jgi:dTDP-D-glucose 4,6-dehydratase